MASRKISRKTTELREILVEEFMKPLGLSRADLALRLGCRDEVIDGIIDHNNPIDELLAIELGKIFGTSANFWMNIQRNSQ